MQARPMGWSGFIRVCLALAGLASLPVVAQSTSGSAAGAAQAPTQANIAPVSDKRVYELPQAERDAIRQAQGVLLKAYSNARAFDAQYQAALAEYEASRLQATASYFAYLPSLRYSESILEFERQNRKTTALSIPVFSIDRIGTFRSADSKAALAMANLRIKEYELLMRVVAAASEFAQACESLRTNEARIATLTGEADKARREYELGQGTITDQRDTQVRLDQARATQQSILARKLTAARSFRTLTGEAPRESDFVLVRRVKRLKLQSMDSVLSLAQASNAELMSAYSGLRLAELEHFRAKGALAPEVNYQITKSQTAVGTNDSQGIVINFPLQAGGVMNVFTSGYGVDKAKAQVRQAELKVGQDVERFHTLVTAGLDESNIRLQAIESAALSVVANEKSFRGGVRTRLDVLNSVQTQFQVNEDYVTSLLSLANNVMNLGIQGAQAPEEIVVDLQRLLFQ